MTRLIFIGKRITNLHMYFEERQKEAAQLATNFKKIKKLNDQSRTNGPINAHLTIAQVMPRYNHNNEKQEALL